MERIAVYDFRIPKHLLCYLINDDASGLEDDDIKFGRQALNKFKELTEKEGGDTHILNYGEPDFSEEAYFCSNPDFCDKACDVYDCELGIFKNDPSDVAKRLNMTNQMITVKFISELTKLMNTEMKDGNYADLFNKIDKMVFDTKRELFRNEHSEVNIENDPEQHLDKFIYKACEEIDAGFFSGDAFDTHEQLSAFEYYLYRWQNQMYETRKSIDEMAEFLINEEIKKNQ